MIRKYTDVVPQAVILGAKGSGKTFLYKKMICEKTWQRFIGNFGTVRNIPDTYILPLISPKNIAEIKKNITETVNENFEKLKGIMGENKLYWYDNISKVERFVQNKRDKVDWVAFWLESIKNVFHDGKSLEEIDNELQNANQRVLFLVDGLEEILQNTFDNENERYAIQGLIQEVITELQIKYKNIGLLVFLRNDLANNSIRTNYEQFENKDVSVAGRIIAKRIMGKASFCTILDSDEKIQSYVSINDLGEESYKAFKTFDIGDIIGITGFVFKTRTC